MRHTVNAGSFLGFGPLFFGPLDSGHSGSFGVAVGYIPEVVLVVIVAELEAPVDVGEFAVVVRLSEAGKGQSFPPYDLESECPQ